MLAMFTCRFVFNQSRFSICVDCDAMEAELTATYARRIVGMQRLTFSDVATPEKARAWVSEVKSEYGNRIEAFDYVQRRQSVMVTA